MSTRAMLKNLTATPFAIALATIGVGSGVRTIIDPQSLPLESFLGSVLQYVWAIQFSLGGSFIIYGTARMNVQVEAMGCALFGMGATIEALAFAFLGNPAGTVATGFAVFNLSIFGVAAFIRMRHLMVGKRLVLLEPGALRSQGGVATAQE
jgi:hypothetical protein